MQTLRRKQLPLYGLAGFGLNLLNTIFAIYLTDALIKDGFGTNVEFWTFAGKTIVAVGIFSILKFLGQLFDGIIDVPLAAAVDKIHTKWGKRRPAILIGLIITMAAYVALCLPPDRAENSMINTVFIGIMSFVFFGAYTLTYVTYYGTFSEVTANSEDRFYLSNWKSFIDTVQYAIAYALIPLFASIKGLNIQWVALALAPVGLTMIIAICMIKERSTLKADVAKYKAEHPNEPESKISDEVGIWESIKYTFKNKNFVMWLVLLAVFYFGLQMFLSGQNVLASGPMGLEGWQIAVINTAAFAPVPLMLYFYKKIMGRTGFRFAFQMALLSFALSMLCFSFAYVKWIDNVYIRLIIGAVGGTFGSFGIGAFFMAPYMIPAQAAAEDREKNKISHAPMFFAVQGLITAGFGALSTGLLWPNLRNNFGQIDDSIVPPDDPSRLFGTHLMPYIVIGACVIAFIICFLLPKSYNELGKKESEVRHCSHCNKDVHVKMQTYQIVILILLILLGIIPGILYGVFYPRRCSECKAITKKIPTKMYCPHCKKEVISKLTTKQIILMVVLFMLGIVPGIFYALFYNKRCPECEEKTDPIRKAQPKVAVNKIKKAKK